MMNEADCIRSLIGRSCLTLDDEDFAGYLALCATDYTYRITAWSPELRKDMTWLEHDREGLAGLFETLPEHLQRSGRLSRHVSIYTIGQKGGDYYSVVSGLVVHHTNIAGRTQTLAVGRYLDTITFEKEMALLSKREVALETRDLGIGLHVPL